MRLGRTILLSVGALSAAISGGAAASETATYTYDSLGRLRKVDLSGGPNGGVQTVICYDAAGNRITYTTALSGGASCSQPLARSVPAGGKNSTSSGAQRAR